jgi:hypothetical protein
MTTLPDEKTLLEDNLRRQLDGHRRLLDCIERTREAVRRADMDDIRSICGEQHAIAQRLAELEKQRLAIVGILTEKHAPDADAPMSLTEIAEVFDEPKRLSSLASELKSVMKDVRSASGVVRAAAQSLATHMTGLMQSVQSMLGRAPVYGRRGRIESVPSQYCLDVRS